MTNEQLTAYLQDETYLYSVSYEELKTLVMQYPYAANLRILLLKKSYLDQNKDYDRNLQMSATYTTNRKHLFKTIKKLKSFKLSPQNVILGEDYLELTELSNIERLLADRQVSDIAYNATKQESLSSDWQLEIDDIAFNEEVTDGTDESFDLSDLSQNLERQSNTNNTEEEEDFSLKLQSEEDEINSLINSLVNQYSKPVLDIKLEDIEQTVDTDLEKAEESGIVNETQVLDLEETKDNILFGGETAIVNEAQVLELEETEDNTTVSNERANEEEEVLLGFENLHDEFFLNDKESKEDVKKADIELEIINQTKAPIIETPVENQLLEKKPSFTEWLSQFRMTKSVQAPSTVVPIEKIEETIEPQTHSQIASNEHLRKTSQKNMLDLFETQNEVPDNLFGLVQTKPPLHFIDDDDDDDEVFSDYESNMPKKQKMRPMHQLAVKSLIPDDELVSETLADLLAWQGNSARAIEMYRKLILRFPEKSSYFATKIEKIS